MVAAAAILVAQLWHERKKERQARNNPQHQATVKGSTKVRDSGINVTRPQQSLALAINADSPLSLPMAASSENALRII